MERPPPRSIELLLPVWGDRHIPNAVELCLPTLLAPGNIPALAAMAECTLVLMAPAEDAQRIAQSEVWRSLASICRTRIEPIDDLVSRSSSTVLTLAYAMAIRRAGASALDTCFVPLVADYVLADGALRNAVRPVFDGAGGVVAGNFAVSPGRMRPLLEARRRADGVLALPARELVGLALQSLDAATASRIVGSGPGLAEDVSRLFWRVDETCMFGRFFLMHMIAIRPETVDFVIGAPSDYSLIPELCPSGRVVRMEDSDHYFTVECGPEPAGDTGEGCVLEAGAIARDLATWATEAHWDNARHAVIYHSAELPAELPEAVAASGAFVSEIAARREHPPLPHRHHPMWRRALDHHFATARLPQDQRRIASITGDDTLGPHRTFSPVSHWRNRLLGRAPHFRPWHPRWPDAQHVKATLRTLAPGGSVLIVADAPAGVVQWLENAARSAGANEVRTLSVRDGTAATPAPGDFDCCLFMPASHSDPAVCAALSGRLKPDGRLIVIIGDIFSDTVTALTDDTPAAVSKLDGETLRLQDIRVVPASALRRVVQRAMLQYARRATRGSRKLDLLRMGIAAGAAGGSLVCNAVARSGRHEAAGRPVSSLVATFGKKPQALAGRLDVPSRQVLEQAVDQ